MSDEAETEYFVSDHTPVIQHPGCLPQYYHGPPIPLWEFMHTAQKVTKAEYDRLVSEEEKTRAESRARKSG